MLDIHPPHSPAAVETMIANSNQAPSDFRLLRGDCESLERIYNRAAAL
jgi:hypothetical protein